MSEVLRVNFAHGMLGTLDSRRVPDGFASFIANADFSTGVPRPIKAPVYDHMAVANAVQFLNVNDLWVYSTQLRDYCSETINGITRVYFTYSDPTSAPTRPRKMISNPAFNSGAWVEDDLGIVPPGYPLQITIDASYGIFNLKAVFVPGVGGTLWTSNLTTRTLGYSVGLSKGFGASTLYGSMVSPVYVQISSPGVVNLTWDPVVAQADNIVVYGRERDKLYVLASLPMATVAWTDDGSANGTAPVTPTNTPPPPPSTPKGPETPGHHNERL